MGSSILLWHLAPRENDYCAIVRRDTVTHCKTEKILVQNKMNIWDRRSLSGLICYRLIIKEILMKLVVFLKYPLKYFISLMWFWTMIIIDNLRNNFKKTKLKQKILCQDQLENYVHQCTIQISSIDTETSITS